MPTKLQELVACPADATPFNRDDVADVHNSGDFRAWVDEHYPSPNIAVRKADLAYSIKEADDTVSWHGALVNPFGWKGAWLATMIGLTVPDMYAKTQDAAKVPNPYHKTERLRKQTHMTAMFGNWSYAAAVNNARLRIWEMNDGPIWQDGRIIPPIDTTEDAIRLFSAKPRKWGDRAKDAAIITHKGKVYVEVRPIKFKENAYFVDGEPVDKTAIEGWLNKKEWAGQAAHQGVTEDQMVHPRDYNIDSFVGWRFAGRDWWVVDHDLVA